MKIFFSGTADFGKLNFGKNKLKKLPPEAYVFLDQIMKEKHTVLIGDCIGVDTLVQEYLNNKKYSAVVVYYIDNVPRNCVNPYWEKKKINTAKTGRAGYTEKDRRMVEDCDEAFAVWDGISNGTANNIQYLKELKKKIRIVSLKTTIFKTE